MLACLSQIESGDNDSAVGSRGERTRYQIGVEELRQHPTLLKHPESKGIATIVATEIWEHRAWHFMALHNRQPTPIEMYALWNAPAKADHPSKAVLERAQRFANLLDKL